MSKKIYVVMGSTGEYSDRTEWPVAAYLEKEKAEQHENLAYDEALKIRGKYKSRFDVPDGCNRFDPDMSMDYTGTEYYHLEISIFEEVPS